MTDLEKHIVYEAMKRIASLGKGLYNDLCKCQGFVKVPFECDGVIDYLVFDPAQKRFTRVEYRRVKELPKGDIIKEELFGDYTVMADYEDIETCFVELK